MNPPRSKPAKFFSLLTVGLAVLLGLQVAFAAVPPEDAIILKVTTFTPPEAPDIPDDLKYTEHRSYYIVQLTETITAQINGDLLAAGVDFVGYISNRAYLVKMTEETKAAEFGAVRRPRPRLMSSARAVYRPSAP